MNNINKQYSTCNKIFIEILSVVSFIYFMLNRFLAPAKFHADSLTIREGMFNPFSVKGSYRNSANFFSSVGLSYSTSPVILTIICWLVFLFILFTILRINKSVNFSLVQMFLIIFFTLMYGFYFIDYSKDIITLIFLSIAINLPPIHHNILINILMAIILYGYFFRYYWIIIGIISLITLIIKHINFDRDIVYIFMAIILFIIIYNFIKNGQITNLRLQENLKRIDDPNARSMIYNLIGNHSIYDDIINYMYVLFSLFLPLQGFSSLNMIIYYLWIITLSLFCIKYSDRINLRILFVLIIFINIQALFEPDFGSVFRHQLSLFPLLYVALFYNFKENCMTERDD